MKAVMVLFLAAVFISAKGDKEAARRKQWEETKKELASLESLKAEKLETLEQKEAQRWDARYRQAARSKENEEKARSSEETYARLAGDMGRMEEDLVKAGNETKDKDEEAAAVQAGWDAFNNSVKRAVDVSAENLSADIPLMLEDRTLRLSHAGDLLAVKPSPDTRGALQAYLDVGLSRLDLTARQTLESRQALFAGGRSAAAWRLQLGTVFVGEVEKGGNGESQILLRTGSLQGKTFVWRSDLAGNYNRSLSAAIMESVQGKSKIDLPMDVLQYKSLGSGFVREERDKFLKRFAAWFKAGGVTLYPLFAVGILALLMILERLVYFSRRNTNAQTFMRGFQALADQRRWREAEEYCARSRSSLARVLGAIAGQANQSRDSAEKAMREAMLREIPALEKRLPLIAAMGAAAPLLGLLGTVSGLVNLFKVLNQLGANDPKVLAGGISEALINTETGLAIAIPVLLVHGFLNEKLDTISATLNSRGLEILNKLWPKG